MGVRQSFFTIALATIGLFLSPIEANAISLRTVSSEAELGALSSRPAFLATGQIGAVILNKAGAAEQRLDWNWSNGEKYPFALSYDGLTARYTVGDKTLETQTQGSSNDIFIYTKATSSCINVVLNNLSLQTSLQNLTISGIAASCETNELSILHISDVGERFTLTGNAMLSWADGSPNSTEVSYQILVGNTNSPTTLPDTNEGSSPSEESSTPPAESETSTGGGWFGGDWLPDLGSGDACINP